MKIQFKHRYTRNKQLICEKWNDVFEVNEKNKRNVKFAIESGMEFKIIEI
jgi:Fe2+ or Zn2+ uptake regulation protein